MALDGARIGIFVDFQFEDAELLWPKMRLQEEGAHVFLISILAAGQVKYTGKYGYPVRSTHSVADVRSVEFDALVFPGGNSPDYLRRDKDIIDMIRRHHTSGKIVASVCHGPWMLCSARILKGVKCTSWFSIRDDVENAGGLWVDQQVVVDKRIITSRNPDDLIAFTRAIIDQVSRTMAE
jgi:protease I